MRSEKEIKKVLKEISALLPLKTNKDAYIYNMLEYLMDSRLKKPNIQDYLPKINTN